MDIKNIVISANYLDFINKIDNLIHELLYSKIDGYILKNSKQALDEVLNVINKFDYEVSKIRQKIDFKNADLIIENKRNSLVSSVQKHYEKQAFVWVDEVYENLIQNCLLSVSLNKENSNFLYNQIQDVIIWYASSKQLSYDSYELLTKEFDKKFIEALNSNDSDFLPQTFSSQSDCKIYFELFDLLINGYEQFLELDLAQYMFSLTNDDFNYFSKMQKEMKTYKKTSILDEMNLIKASVEKLNTKNLKDKYVFIKKLLDDFILFKSENQGKITEFDKVNIIKRRLKLSSDNFSKNQSYFISLLSS